MHQPDSSFHEGGRRNRTRFRAYLIGGALLVAATLAVAFYLNRPPGIQARLEDAQIAFDNGNYPRSLRLASEIFEDQPDSGPAALLAGRSAQRLKRFEEAITWYDRVPRDDSQAYVEARLAAGDICLGTFRRLTAAAERYRDVLAVDADHADAIDRLSFLLGLASRRREQVHLRLRMIRAGRVEPVFLLSLALGDSAFENQELIEEYHRVNPQDPFLLISRARIATEARRHEESRAILRQAVQANPELIPAQAALGTNLLGFARESDFLKWHSALPKTADKSADIWVLRARWLAKNSRRREAVRCYAEAMRLDPNHSRANFQLGQLLTSLKQESAAAPFLERARRLRKYINAAKSAFSGGGESSVRQAAEIAESLSLNFEAFGWARVVAKAAGASPPQWAQAMIDRLQPRLKNAPLVRTSPENNPVQQLVLHRFPMPVFPKPSSDSAAGPQSNEKTTVTFADSAAAAGLKFRYFNGRGNVESGLKSMYEFAGGGAAVLDFDNDLRPDIYLAQGARWPVKLDQNEHLDAIFHNVDGRRFENVTSLARLRESGFSQGATVGDFDSDGFPDLFIANIGRNRLFHNNGDGTFSEVELPGESQSGQWSTSALLADLNGDRHPDLYVVNYLSGDDVFTRTCRSDGREGICLPQVFPAAQDRIYISTGDGGFVDRTETAGIKRSDGKGLGIVAVDLEGKGRLSLFVANDTTPNFYFVPSSKQSSNGRLFVERGMRSGLAMSGSGKTESCMGIALGDADGDGRLDLFATNFFSESNTLYRQTAARTFQDVTRFSGLREASLPMVGFGTQFLDAENDGRLDLIVTNGHIDDFRSSSAAEFQMLPQFFANRGKGRFELARDNRLGPYFQKKYLGRALARLDWNGDGRDDVVVTHLDAPVALLTNTTEKTGHWLSIRLRGTVSNRDAIGTTIVVETETGKLTRQLTAGDGYLASNERRLVFGLGTATNIRRILVNWPSGRRDVFQPVPVDRDYLIVEGAMRPLLLP